jgi:hypothetical protein
MEPKSGFIFKCLVQYATESAKNYVAAKKIILFEKEGTDMDATSI